LNKKADRILSNMDLS